jgi:hypothetical protein
MFGIMSLHTYGDIARYALVWMAIFMLSPALMMMIGALGFIFLPVAVTALPFVLWAFYGPEKREVVKVVHEHQVRVHGRLAHA